jgi:hypothetical protein
MGSYGYRINPYYKPNQKTKNAYSPTLSNGDTVKQLLEAAICYKSRGKWTVNQEEQVVI